MSTLYLIRARLRSDASSKNGFAKIIRGDALGHQAVWTMFGGEPLGSRPFLYRQETAGSGASFLVLARREPDDPHGLWDIESKPFAPSLKKGTRLEFSLRANPTLRRAKRKSDRDSDVAAVGKRIDVIMDAKHSARLAGEEIDERALIEAASLAWLKKRGARAGFRVELEGFAAEGYRQHRLPRRDGDAATFSTIDLSGALVVEEVATFLDAVAGGIGPEKAFGCGLMLIRRG